MSMMSALVCGYRSYHPERIDDMTYFLIYLNKVYLFETALSKDCL